MIEMLEHLQGIEMQCKGKTKNGSECKNKAIRDGYCKRHHPDTISKKEESHKQIQEQKKRFHEVLDLVRDTSEAKGWSYRLGTCDSKYYRYATVIVRRHVEKSSYSSDEVVGEFNITVNDGVKVGHTNTSFYSYGLRSLQDSITDELGRLSWLEPKNKKKVNPPEIESIERLIGRFHVVATQLKRRYSGRETIKVSDEYDAQDLLHGLLKIYFDDVRPEDYSPSRGGASSRLDFLLKREKIVIEVKMASAKLTDKKIGEQLIIDIERYREHPDCDTLICFVYDPDMHIRNPTGIEKDLSRKEGSLTVKVMVVPK